ncbi:small multidrug resistance pump [Methylohalomonas lacus]|uniref:Small multidrug resistance pump n=1 Tax=Methylohalomonas lacus TaxID=398773 RepID=A0AAE3HM31_9GAMM|nr:multidrug efflux SMR transporter [Methylohalomonas lacus]MCS3903783.1 small multidrug resistance pump [Methylohalomonas lacus]
MPHYIYLAIAIVAEVSGTLALRASESFTRLGPSLIVVIGYALAFYFLSLTLKHIPVGIAYAIWSGAGIVLIAAFGYVVFSERLDWPALLGMLFIVAGIVMLTAVSKSIPSA